MSAASNPDLVQLVGSWCLRSIVLTFTDTNESVEPLGPDPDGRMVLMPNGRVMFLFTKLNRAPPTNEAERATLFNETVAYAGLVRPDGPGRFITAVDVALHPAWASEQLRFYTIDGDRLTIRTPEQTIPQFPGRTRISEVVFVREHPAS